MRAPPEAETTITGHRSAMDRSMARVIFSPITEPMLPPMNFGSIAQMFTWRAISLPLAEISASFRLVAARVAFRRSLYGFESTKFSGSLDISSRSCSS